MGIKPKLRPKDDEFKKIVAAANSGGGDSAAPAAKGGKGGGKSVNPLAKEGSADYKKMQKANTDNSYGYYDVNTGDYVPWYIDIQNGGGMNTAGPTFEGGFGTVGLIGGLLNAAGVSPYGQDRPRAFMPMEAYRGGKDKPAPFDYRGGGSAAPASTGVIDAVSKPDPIQAPTQDFSNLSNAAATRRSLVGYNPQVVASTPAQSYATMPMGELGRGTPRPLTGTADMPPGLLPMTHLRNFGPNSAFNQLYDRLGGVEPDNSYAAEKGLIELAAYANSPYTDNLTDEEYGDLMPPEIGNVSVNFSPSTQGQPTSLLDTKQQAPSRDEVRVFQKIVDGNMIPQFMEKPPHVQRAYVKRLLELGY